MQEASWAETPAWPGVYTQPGMVPHAAELEPSPRAIEQFVFAGAYRVTRQVSATAGEPATAGAYVLPVRSHDDLDAELPPLVQFAGDQFRAVGWRHPGTGAMHDELSITATGS